MLLAAKMLLSVNRQFFSLLEHNHVHWFKKTAFLSIFKTPQKNTLKLTEEKYIAKLIRKYSKKKKKILLIDAIFLTYKNKLIVFKIIYNLLLSFFEETPL